MDFETLVKKSDGKHEKSLFNVYLMARWAVTLMPESELLRNYFLDIGADKIRR